MIPFIEFKRCAAD